MTPVVRQFAACPRAEYLPEPVMAETFCDPLGIAAFWAKWYLDGFVDQGNGKVKVVLGRPGAGKTHLLRYVAYLARNRGYTTALIDAGRHRLASIDEVYRLVARQIAWQPLVEHWLIQIVQRDLGYVEFQGRSASDLAAWARGGGVRDLMLFQRDVREAVERRLHSLDLARDFFVAVRSLALSLAMEGEPRGGLVTWILGDRLDAASRRALGLGDNVNRQNGRALLASLARLLHGLGQRGLVIAVDNIQAVAATRRVEGQPYYTRANRDQHYEMLRQLIDDTAITPYLMVYVVGDLESVTNVRSGFPSYPALWARLQNEVKSSLPNLFADVISLDELWAADQELGEQLAARWSAARPWTELTPIEEAAPDSYRVEWALPRRLVVDVLHHELPEEGEG
ncbi:MAG: DUF2791 family P-loop domain-containing protein [Firmicutes bacterium]|nr:DUF2791 family P-loop domain-containing protein [Bacillota bacterium]